MQENLATLLEVVADVAGDRPAVVHGDRVLSWAQLDDRASRLAGYLSDRGVRHGSRVGIALYNGCEYVETVLAVMKLRAAPVNVNYRYQEGELRELFADSGMHALVYDEALTSRVVAAASDAPALGTLVRVGQDGDYGGAIAGTEPAPRVARSAGDTWLMFTGGTTGRPKGVQSNHRALTTIATANGYAVLGRQLPDDLDGLAAATAELLVAPRRMITVVAPPLMHATGMYIALGTLLAAGTVVFLPSRSFDPQELAEVAQRHLVTDICIVGDVYARPFADVLAAAAGAGRPVDLSRLRRIVSVGVTWSADVKQRLLDHCDAMLHDVLAASEGGPFAVSVTRRGQHRPTAHFELAPGARVIDEQGRDVPAGSGEVGYLAAPAHEGIRYLDDPAKSADTFRLIDGRRYAVPGDMAMLHDDGSLFLLGRGNRVINTGGEKVFAEEVEQVVVQHPAVADANVVGLPDPRWGQRISAVVELRPGARLSADELSEHVGANLAGYKRPRTVVFVPRLHRKPSGKADLSWAREVALAAVDRTGSIS